MLIVFYVLSWIHGSFLLGYGQTHLSFSEDLLSFRNRIRIYGREYKAFHMQHLILQNTACEAHIRVTMTLN